MKNSGDPLDRMIRDALSKEDAEAFDASFEDDQLLALVARTFRGRMRWLSVVAIVFALVWTVLGFYSLTRFLGTEEVQGLLRWGALMFFCMGSVMALKIWHWMEIQRHMITREIKRLELQVANLGAERSMAG